MRRTRMITEKFEGAPLFAGFTARQLAPLAAHADRLTIESGRVLTQAGGTALEAMVIIEGTAIERGPGQDEKLLGPGTALAVDAVAVRGAFPTTVTAHTALEVLVVNGPSFRSAVGDLPLLARRVTGGTARPQAATRRGRARRATRDGARRPVVVGLRA